MLDNASVNYRLFAKDLRILGLLQNAYQMYQAKNWRVVGQAISWVAVDIKNREAKIPLEYIEEEEEDYSIFERIEKHGDAKEEAKHYGGGGGEAPALPQDLLN